MDTIAAASASRLRNTLSAIDISVPLRTEGRTTDHAETWSICRFLATFSEVFEYPLTLSHQDRPDFLLAEPGRKIGIEVTELVPRNYAAIDAYREKRNVEGPFGLQRHNPEDPPLRGPALAAQAESVDSGDVWVGDSVERDWAAAARVAICGKITKADKDGFERFDEDWLLIYDNWPVPGLDQEKAILLLAQHLNSIKNLPFHRIVVEFSTNFWVYERPESYTRKIVNLWQ